MIGTLSGDGSIFSVKAQNYKLELKRATTTPAVVAGTLAVTNETTSNLKCSNLEYIVDCRK